MTTQATATLPTPAEMLASILRPNPNEADYAITDVEGEIPRELNGTLYRNGPNQKILPKEGAGALHLFDGDALIQAIRFEDGKAHHLGRYARTEGFEFSEKEGTYRGGINVPAEGSPEEIPGSYQPNTNVVFHGGRLLALVEVAPPFVMDPTTLESKGTWDLDGRMLGMSTTAHPKIDGRTGQMLIHGYQPVEPYVQLYVIEPDGTVSLAEAVEAPWASMMHDFAITESYVIFPLGSVQFDLEPMLDERGFGEAVKGVPDRNMKFGVRRREPGSPTKWIDVPSAGYMFHPGNAYEKDGKIFMDACTYENPQGLLDELGTVRSGRNESEGGFVAHPYLYEIDPEAGTCSERKLSDMTAEFPRLDDRLVGHENQFGYAATGEPGAGSGSFFRRITKYDRKNGTSIHRQLAEGQWVGEPVFVPRAADAAEDDGFVLNLVYDATTDRTAVDVLDARAIDSEPLARLWLQERIPLGFHGNYKAAS